MESKEQLQSNILSFLPATEKKKVHKNGSVYIRHISKYLLSMLGKGIHYQ